jgi:hypothetical protein
MTTIVLEQLATQRQAELATRAARHQRHRQPRLSTATAGTPRTQSSMIAARLAGLVGRS